MNDFLFDVPETLSPRLAWMRDNGVHTEKDEYDEAEPRIWTAYKGEIAAYGDTQDEALDALAKRLNIKPWRA